MPSINRIRVNNVKYNFGTQQYDDFTMRMYGRNTLYDLANGGGKSILMLLLLQNLIPNCTLDDKQPIEKLFRAGCGNTVIHSLIEWKLDEADIENGYRYMTTGFCARKAKDEDGSNKDGGSATEKDTAAIEYFNYCIFYREYNRNDIVNLPLSKDNEKITFSGLKNYLKDLARKDLSLDIHVFERKGEYQRFISQYGLHESHWEIIRGINKTEGHVRTYFETNYRTTRKVVEDLLIEEIIEKAFLTKTGRNGEEDDMAQTLLDIKEKLNQLARKKRDIANYDHQIELINVLQDRVNSCMDLYDEYDSITKSLADIYVTGKEFTSQDSDHAEELLAKKQDSYEKKEAQKLRLDNLKVTKQYLEADQLKQYLERLEAEISVNEEKLKEARHFIALKESINEYVGYVKDRSLLKENEKLLENIMNSSDVDIHKMKQYAWNKKQNNDFRLAELNSLKVDNERTLVIKKEEQAEAEKLLREGQIAKAVADSNIIDVKQRIEGLNDKINELTASVDVVVVGDTSAMYEASEKKRKNTEEKLTALQIDSNSLREEMYEDKYNLSVKNGELPALEKKYESANEKAALYGQVQQKFKNIIGIYGASEPSLIEDIISARIKGAYEEIVKKRTEVEELKRQEKLLGTGQIFGPMKGAEAVINYIETRHGTMAVFGANYLAALDPDRRKSLLNTNPALPYGVIVKDFAAIKDDINLPDIDTGSQYVMIYDMNSLAEPALYLGNNAVAVTRSAEYFADEEVLNKLKKDAHEALASAEDELSIINDSLSTYDEDLTFVRSIVNNDLVTADEELKAAEKELADAKDEIKGLYDAITELTIRIDRSNKEMDSLTSELAELTTSTDILKQIFDLSEELKKEIVRLNELNVYESTLSVKIEELKGNELKAAMTVGDLQARAEKYTKDIGEINEKWEQYYAAYYDDMPGVSYDRIILSDEEIDAEFMAMYKAHSYSKPDIEDKKKLINALKSSMERTMRTIEKRGITEEEILSSGDIVVTDEETLETINKEIARLTHISSELTRKHNETSKEINKLEGSTNYALENIIREYGAGSYVKEDITLTEAKTAIENGDQTLGELERQYKECVREYESYVKEQGYMTDLFKDVKRIVDTNDIDVAAGKILYDDKEKLRDAFEGSLFKFDRSRKNLDRAKNDLMRYKGQTAEALSAMGVFEMAATIRNDVNIPDNYYDARALLDNLSQIIEFIRLEKGRVAKGIEDMETIKENFENQCIQRCMDVKTELEKLPKLSKINMGNEVIKMVDLSIPYVKDEFVKQRMSEYIDNLVKSADTYEDERKRVKFIKESLGLKRLFGVMVTDMNAIKLKLYKRERIKEQSRYLRYEEAVGSTGQSQGIYIQFLVAIINYIAGMYSFRAEDTVTTKTIFIDNPFGAAKDIYIWEPIFAMLSANHVQLIVPARGATPAITGRFDVNYVLGQQMVGGKQQTVVIDYNSKTDGEELEYHELSYEQATFDFI